MFRTIKIFPVLLLVFMLVFCAVACAPEIPPAADPSPFEEAEPTAESNTEELREEALAAYRMALAEFLATRSLPTGDVNNFYSDSIPANDRFAILDVDGDGREELILAAVPPVMAGQVEYIYDYEESTGTLREEFYSYPYLIYYDNGIIWAGWSHNQGYGGDFWPYSLYQYDPAQDAYIKLGMVDAWDKSYVAVDASGIPFPDDIDVSGTGFVYYIMPGDTYDDTAPVDSAVYQEWYDFYLAGANKITIPYIELTEENIAAIGQE